MILLLLALIVSATADPDYYAVEIAGEWRKIKIFTKISECTGAVYYQSGDKRVMFKDGVWKIGTLTNDFDCNILSSVVNEEYRTKFIAQRPEHRQWYKMNDLGAWIAFEYLYKRVQKPLKGFKLVGGTMVDDKSKEDCFKEDWGEKYPNKDIVVAFQDSKCYYDFVDRAQLEYSIRHRSATVFVHPAGKNILEHTYK